jgi:hypothetical protein
VNAKDPELHLQLERDHERRSTTQAVQAVGWTPIFSEKTDLSAVGGQESVQSEFCLRFFVIWFVNFDDLPPHRGCGGSAESGAVRAPASGKPVSDEFTKELGQVSHNGVALDAARQNIVR